MPSRLIQPAAGDQTEMSVLCCDFLKKFQLQVVLHFTSSILQALYCQVLRSGI